MIANLAVGSPSTGLCLRLVVGLAAAVLGPHAHPDAATPAAVAGSAPRLIELSIEQLGQIEVTSVSRREESLSVAPANVHVITEDQIRRSGVTSIPEALRLAPGVEVVRNSANSWTISMRGFTSDLSNKLLVLIDGRSVYSPLFSGVFWDVQDTLLQDVERIEVIGGPGGTLWGANAVNGVINIITRSAWDTQGGVIEVAAGDEDELLAGLRYGAQLRPDLAARAYLKHFERDHSRTREGARAHDDWDMTQAGFRLDWVLGATDSLTVQGDVYDGDQSALLRSDFTLGTLPETDVPGTVEVSGHNLLGRWSRQLAHGAELRVQAYYDHTERDIPGSFSEERDTVDVDVVHNLALIGRHDIIWGAGVRVTSDDIGNTRFATFDPESRTDETYSFFVQDKIGFRDDRLFLTLGTKLEHNDYSGSEHQPNVRLSWLPTEHQTLWASVSRAVRIPARLNHDLELYAPVGDVGVPLYLNVRSSDDFDPEKLIAYELGYRITIRENLSGDAAIFYHDYDRLMTNEAVSGPVLVPGPPPYLILPIVQANGMRGETYGGTLDVKWQPLDQWRLEFQLSYLDFDLELRDGQSQSVATAVAGNSPEWRAAVYSNVDLPGGLSLYTGVRYVDELPAQNVPSYVAVDVNLQWQVTSALRASVAVRDLADPQHPEFGDGREIERAALLKLVWEI